MADIQKPTRKREKCPYGFSCGDFMMIQGMIAHDCENLNECKRLTRARGISWLERDQDTYEIVMYFEDDVLEDQQRQERWAAEYEARQQRNTVWAAEQRRIRHTITVRQHEVAVAMLKSRGNHQDYSNFELDETAAAIAELTDSFNQELEQLAANDNGYIAPDGVEAHVYNVKRPSPKELPEGLTRRQIRALQSVFHYHKITSKQAQFVAFGRDEEGNPKRCKVIHTSHTDNARNIQSRLGIERRNKLSKIRTRLLRAKQVLDEAIAIAQEEYNYEDILLQSQEAIDRSQRTAQERRAVAEAAEEQNNQQS